MKAFLSTILASSTLAALPAAYGSDLFEPFEHIHFSSRGTPIIHSFGIEPAFTGRDLFLDYRYREGDGFTENEIEVELEWAFTKRLGVILEAPYIFEDEDGEGSASGFGDLAIVPRILLFEGERFLFTAQVEVVVPSGSDAFGGETAIAPGFSAWNDLGNWFTLNTQMGVEHVFDEDITEFFFGFGLVKSFDLGGGSHAVGDDAGHDHTGHDHEGHDHRTAKDLLNLHLEVTGSVGLDGEDEGILSAEGLAGVSYGISDGADIRVAYEFPLSNPREFDGGVFAGIIIHF